MSRAGLIYAVRWTLDKHKIVQTKKEGAEELRAWKTYYESQGWTVRGSGADHYIATPPGREPPFTVADDPRHAIRFCVYDEETKQEVWEPPKPKVARPKSDEPKPRRGRKPVGV